MESKSGDRVSSMEFGVECGIEWDIGSQCGVERVECGVVESIEPEYGVKYRVESIFDSTSTVHI